MFMPHRWVIQIVIYWVANLSSFSAYLWSRVVLALDVYAAQMGDLNSDILGIANLRQQFKCLPLVSSCFTLDVRGAFNM